MVSRRDLRRDPNEVREGCSLAESTASAKALRRALLSVDRETWGHCGWSRVTGGGEVRVRSEKQSGFT